MRGMLPDGIVLDGGMPVAGLEIKCPAPDTFVEWGLAGEIPPEHLPQIHGSMIVTGLTTWHFMAHFQGCPPLIKTARWNSYTDKLKTAIEEFVIRYSIIRPQVLKVLGKEEG